MNDEFKTIARYQTIRTAFICGTVLLVAYWAMPVLLAALKP